MAKPLQGHSRCAVPADRTKARILAAAEHLFAGHGYEGTSIRQIAEDADVNVAAINYHFGSKQQLFEEVFALRVLPINEERLRLLDAALTAAGGIGVRPLVDAFVRPPLSLSEARNGEAQLVQMKFLSRAFTIPDEHEIMRNYYSHVRSAFVAAFRIALPDLTSDALVWRYNLMVGALVYAMAGNERALHVAEDTGGRDPQALDPEEMIRQVTAFCTAGLTATGGAA